MTSRWIKPRPWACSKPSRRLADDRGGLLHRQRAAGANEPPQIGARHVLGHEKVDVAVLAGVERAHEVLMIELRVRPNLAAEVGDRLGRRAAARQHLHGDDAPHDRVFGLEDLAHAALADRVDHVVGAEIELRAAVAQLLDLPGVELAAGDELASPSRSSEIFVVARLARSSANG